MSKFFKITLALVASVLLLLAIGVASVDATGTEQCQYHETTLKIEVPHRYNFEEDGPIEGSLYELDYVIDGPTVTFSLPANFCVKAGNKASFYQTGTTYTVTWTVGKHGQIPDISYVVVYRALETPQPTIEPTPEVTPSPTIEVTPSPSPSQSTTPTPSPSETEKPTMPDTATAPFDHGRALLITVGLLVMALGLYILALRLDKD